LNVPRTLLLIKFLGPSIDRSTCVSAAKLKIQIGLYFNNMLVFSYCLNHIL